MGFLSSFVLLYRHRVWFYPENNRPDVLMLFSVCVFSMIAGSVVFDVRHKRNSVR